MKVSPQPDGSYPVLNGFGQLLAGPFSRNDDAWAWIDRQMNERNGLPKAKRRRKRRRRTAG